MELEIIIMQAIFELHGQLNWLDSFFFYLAEYSSYFFALIMMAVTGYIIYGKLKQYECCRLAYIYILPGSLLVNHVVREMVTRERPYAVLEEYSAMVSPLFQFYGDSFPSNHACACFAITLIVYLVHSKAGWWCLALSVFVSISRVYTGVHFPSDVLAGGLVAVLMFYLLHWKISPVENVNTKCFYFILSRIRVLNVRYGYIFSRLRFNKSRSTGKDYTSLS